RLSRFDQTLSAEIFSASRRPRGDCKPLPDLPVARLRDNVCFDFFACCYCSSTDPGSCEKHESPAQNSKPPNPAADGKLSGDPRLVKNQLHSRYRAGVLIHRSRHVRGFCPFSAGMDSLRSISYDFSTFHKKKTPLICGNTQGRIPGHRNDVSEFP